MTVKSGCEEERVSPEEEEEQGEVEGGRGVSAVAEGLAGGRGDRSCGTPGG